MPSLLPVFFCQYFLINHPGTDIGKQDNEKCIDKPKRIYKVKTYVGLVLPMHVGSGMMEYSILDGNNDNLIKRNVALFGGNPSMMTQ